VFSSYLFCFHLKTFTLVKHLANTVQTQHWSIRRQLILINKKLKTKKQYWWKSPQKDFFQWQVGNLFYTIWLNFFGTWKMNKKKSKKIFIWNCIQIKHNLLNKFNCINFKRLTIIIGYNELLCWHGRHTLQDCW
jgi:hypothetical protein